MEDRIINIEKELSSLESEVKSIHYSIQRVRDQKSELPVWMRNGAVILFLAIFAQAMTSVWWASNITAVQEQLIVDVRDNTLATVIHMDNYHEIIIELNKLSVSLELLTDQNKSLLRIIYNVNGVEI